MLEKRKSPRFPATITLHISSLHKQNTSGIHGLETPIALTDISTDGVGFTSECVLPLNYYFNASILSQNNICISATIQILRCDVIDHDHYAYGCRFTELDEDSRAELEKCLKANGCLS